MSPVRIEARREISLQLLDKKVVKLSKGEILSIPDAPSKKVIEVDAKDIGFTISKRAFPNPKVSRRADAIEIQGDVEGWILPQKGEKQTLQKPYICSAGDLEKNPVTILFKNKEIVKVTWEEE